MTVIKTNKWLEESYQEPIKICGKLQSYFTNATPEEIYEYLVLHGMYRPVRNGRKMIDTMLTKKIWELVKKEEMLLKRKWAGPNIPIFILPSDVTNYKMKKEFNGKSGLAYKDKLFLFFTDTNDLSEIKAVFTHEYNHVCRLNKLDKEEKDFTLLDSIIMEGIAEHAVMEQVGKESVAQWTSYYSEKQLRELWENIIYPNKSLAKRERKHQVILYGMNYYPKMAGYCVGYYLVENYLKKKNITCNEIIGLSANTIAQLN